MNIKVPCLNCMERHINCHSKCEKYIKFKKEHDKLKEKLDNLQHQQSDYYAIKEYNFKRRKRR